MMQYMPKRSRMPSDPNLLASKVVTMATTDSAPDAPAVKKPVKKNVAAVALGRKGGLKGGKARAAKLTSGERSAIAKKAAGARWARPKDEIGE